MLSCIKLLKLIYLKVTLSESTFRSDNLLLFFLHTSGILPFLFNLFFLLTSVFLWNTSNMKHLFHFHFAGSEKVSRSDSSPPEGSVALCFFVLFFLNEKNTVKMECNVDSQGRLSGCLVFSAAVWGFTMQCCRRASPVSVTGEEAVTSERWSLVRHIYTYIYLYI